MLVFKLFINHIISALMKKIILSLFAASLLICSCSEDIIDLVPIGDTEGSFFKNEEQMTMAVFALYQKNCFFYMFRGGQNNHLSAVYLLPSDDITVPSNVACENFVQLNDGNSHLSNYYQFAYQLIARANVILEKIETTGDDVYQLYPEEKDLHKGEALFFRGYMHMNLWNVFGIVPKATEYILDLDKAYLPNTVGTELLDQAIADFEEAAKLLPDSWDDSYRGRVTKNSALGMRGKALIFRGTVGKSQSDFTAAISDFNAISGRSLTATYGDNFECATENNEESLFEYQANQQLGNTNAYLNNDQFSVIGEIGHYIGMYVMRPSWIGNVYYRVTTPMIDAYDEGDPRRAYNFDETLASTTSNILKYTHNTIYVPGAIEEGISTNNVRILRYADVLLLKAEAIVRSGGSLSEAIGLINQIRERARNSDASGTPSAFPADRNVAESDRNTVLEWVFQERRLELFAEEGHRWWDLRRRHIAGEIDLKTVDFGSLNNNFDFKDHNVNFPIPGREVVANEFLKQNDGY